MNHADELTNKMILNILRDPGYATIDNCVDQHYRECSDVRVISGDVQECRYYDTGVTGIELEAMLECPHNGQGMFTYGELGSLADFIEEMIRLDEYCQACQGECRDES